MAEPIFLEGLVNTEDLGIDTSQDNEYHVSYSSSEVGIVDVGGNDTIVFEDVYAKIGHNINFFFDVPKDPEGEYDGVLFVIKDDKLQEYARCVEELAPEKTFLGSMWIAADIEKFKVRHGIEGEFVQVDNYFEKVKENVGAWFNKYGDKYGDRALLALATCTDKTALNELISCYTKELCPIELIETVLNENGYEGVRPNEFLGGSGNEVIYATTDSIVSANQGNDKLLRGEYNDAPATNYKLYGEAGNDILEAGMGAILNGGLGENVIVVDGDADCIIEKGNGKDYINFVNATGIDDLEFSQNGQDLIIQVSGENERVTLKDYYKYKTNYSVKGISFGEIGNIKDLTADNYLYANDIVKLVKEKSILPIIGSENADTIQGTKGDDYIIGQGGADKLSGLDGKNTFVFDINESGASIISGKGEDTIRFVDNNDYIPEQSAEQFLSTLQYFNKGNDLRISLDEGNTYITIKNYLANPDKSSVKYIEFAKGENVYREELSDLINIDIEGKGNIKGTNVSDEIGGSTDKDTIKAGKGYDEVFGDKGDDKLYGEYDETVFYFDKGDGKDTIYAGKGVDYIHFTDMDGSGDTFDEGDLRLSVDRNDLIIKYSENDSIRLANYLTKGSGIQEISGTNSEHQSWTTTVEALLADNPIEIQGQNGKKNNLKGTGLIDEIDGGNWDDTIRAGNNNDFITGGKGNDKLYGEGGNDTYIFNEGDEKDTIFSGKNDGADTIQLNDILVDDIELSVNKNDLVIRFKDNENDSIALSNYLTKGSSVTTIKDYNGGEKSIETLIAENPIIIKGLNGKRNNLKGSNLKDIISGAGENDTISGMKGDDILYGLGKDDTLKGGDGNDLLYGGEGKDKLFGENGTNGFFFKAGDGVDTITMGKGKDILVFDTSLEGTLEFVQNKKNLEIIYGDGSDKVIVTNYFGSKNPTVNKIVFADYNNTSIDLENIDADINLNNIFVKGENGYIEFSNEYGSKTVKGLIYHGGNQDNVIFGDSSKNTLIEGGFGNDIIYCNSKLTGAYGGYESGIVNNEGHDGHDEYVVKSLNNGTIISDKGGEDTILINEDRFNARGQENNIYFLFDVVKEGGVGEPNYNDMYILNQKAMNTLSRTKDLNKVTTGIQVTNALVDGAIETIETKDGYYINSDTLEAVRQNVATWLANNTSCNTAYQALQDPTVDLEGLLAAYNVAWQQG